MKKLVLSLFIVIFPLFPLHAQMVDVSGGAIAHSFNVASFTGANWGAKLNACSTFASAAGGGTCLIPDSIAGDASSTTISIASNVIVLTTGRASFTMCTINMGKFSKWRNAGDVILVESGSNCPGITHLGATATLQDSDHFVIDGARINCNSQTNSVGITDTPSSNGAQDEIVNVSVQNCTTKGIYLDRVQFGHFRNWILTGNYVNFVLYASAEPGGASSNTFQDIKASSNGSGVNAIFWNNATTSPMTSNLLINYTPQNGTIASTAVIGKAGLANQGTHIRFIGGSPEHDGGGAASVTIDGNVISQGGALFTSNAYVEWDGVDSEEAIANPVIKITNNSLLRMSSPRGGSLPFKHFILPDTTSSVVYEGVGHNSGDAQNVASYPEGIPLAGASGVMAGKIQSSLVSDIPNAFTGNPLIPAFSSTTGTTSNAITNDATYGPVNCVTFAGSLGSDSTNRVVFTDWVGAHPGSAWDFMGTWMVQSSTTESFKMTGTVNIPGWNGNGSSPEDNLNLAAGTWTHIRSYKTGNSSGTGAVLEMYPIGTSAPTVCFTRVQTLAIVAGSAGEEALMSRVMQGAINPNIAAPTISSGFGTSPSVASSSYDPRTQAATMRVNVGTGGTATNGVIGLPQQANGWNCHASNITASAAHRADNTRHTASSTTSVTIENQTISTGAAVAWTASDIVELSCSPY
jgi:hypothetical protein